MATDNRVLTKHRAGGRGGAEFGFTLIEILIVVVVLGILAAIVVFALTGVTGRASTSACSTDSRTVDVATRVLSTENPAGVPTTSLGWKTGLLPGSSFTGAPYLHAWPSGSHYTVSVAGDSAPATTGDSPAIAPTNGDIIVTVTSTGKTYDFTRDPTDACTSV